MIPQGKPLRYTHESECMRIDRRWIARIAAAIFAVVLLYPITAIFAHVGSWQWDEDVRGPLLSSVRVSLVLTA
jgi:hypothetical protein